MRKKRKEQSVSFYLNYDIINIMKKIDRKDFVLKEYEKEAYEDYPLPIGFNQTISQPSTVNFMLKLLDPQKQEKILDLGSGSGFSTALLAEAVGEKGKVFGVEKIPELVSFGRKNLSKYDFNNATILEAGETLGLPSEAPFDKILVSASAKEIPQELIDQLKVGGIMVIPVENDILRIKKTKYDIEIEKYEGFVFVPLR
ncbi:MAG: protein-L-isoaspartate O-methyltransferase [Candidatus Pacebacteria bacterium]|nr:protein-L-isoaspartate O-methyltransferase [Candidatus Paceibacterota bacterium]